MKVGRVEISDRRQALGLKDAAFGTVQKDQAVPPEILQHPIHMNLRHPQAFAKVGLRERQAERAAVRKPDCLKPVVKLQQKVSHAAQRVALPHAEYPLPKNCGVDQRFSPERSCEVWPRLDDGAEFGVSDEAEDTFGNGRQIMVHNLEMKALEIRDFAGNVDRKHLSFTFLRGL